MNKETQHRLKSPVFWTAMVAQILSLLVYFGVLDMGMSETIKNGVCLVLELLVTFGILNNPTCKDSF